MDRIYKNIIRKKNFIVIIDNLKLKKLKVLKILYNKEIESASG